MTDLVKRARERAESYRLGGPSSEHTAALLDEMADRIEELERKAGMATGLASLAGAGIDGHAALIKVAKDQQARIEEMEEKIRVMVCHAALEYRRGYHKGRREVLEEAARVAEAPTDKPARCREDIAADIRALMEKGDE